MRCVVDLGVAPVVGERYLVPCVFGSLHQIMRKSVETWYPVLLPPHEDSRYLTKVTTEWVKNGDNGFRLVTRDIPYDGEPSPLHYHVDARFTAENWYGNDRGRPIDNLQAVIFPKDYVVEYRAMECLREMPDQVHLYKVFGRQFVEDFECSKMKCFRCPHKGIDLRGIPVKDGVVVCPAHGMRIDVDSCKPVF